MHPMLAAAGPLPVGPGWLYEVKWDGMRLLADRTERGLRLGSRTDRDMTRHFPELAELVELAPDVLLDGEVVALVRGVPSFAALSERFHRVPSTAEVAANPVTYLVFDVLRLYGVPLLDRPLADRRATLERLELAGLARVALSPTYDDGAALQSATRDQGLEGVVAKRRDSTYQPGRRAGAWVKSAHRHTQDCVIGGWRPERTAPSRIGALLIGIPDDEQPGLLQFAGRVGSGLGAESAQRALRAALVDAAESPFIESVPREDLIGTVWVAPTIGVEVTHSGWTEGRRLRHPVLTRIRTDR